MAITGPEGETGIRASALDVALDLQVKDFFSPQAESNILIKIALSRGNGKRFLPVSGGGCEGVGS